MARVIFHLDMDAFYASVEQRDNPALRGKPVIVGGQPTGRGVVCAASYEARKFGVRSAMPSTTAGRLCPQGIFIAPRMDRYKAESDQIMQLLAQTGAVIEAMSIDEAYLDMSSALPGSVAAPSGGQSISGLVPAGEADAALYRAVPLAQKLKGRIFAERQLRATIGIASNKL